MKKLFLVIAVVSALTVGTAATALAAVYDQQDPAAVSDVSDLATVQDQEEPGVIAASSSLSGHESFVGDIASSGLSPDKSGACKGTGHF